MPELAKVWESNDACVYTTSTLNFFQKLIDKDQLKGYLVHNNKRELVLDNQREVVYRIKNGITLEETRKLYANKATLLSPTWYSVYDPGRYERQQNNPEKTPTYNLIVADRFCSLDRIKVPFENFEKAGREDQSLILQSWRDSFNWLNSTLSMNGGGLSLDVDPNLVDAVLTVRFANEIGDFGTVTVEGYFDALFRDFCDRVRGAEPKVERLEKAQKEQRNNESGFELD